MAPLGAIVGIVTPRYSNLHDPAAAGGVVCAGAAEPGVWPGGLPAPLRPAGELGQITAPTLILAGRHDWICPAAFSEEINRLIPNADRRVLEQSSHSIRADQPPAMLDAIVGLWCIRGASGCGRAAFSLLDNAHPPFVVAPGTRLESL